MRALSHTHTPFGFPAMHRPEPYRAMILAQTHTQYDPCSVPSPVLQVMLDVDGKREWKDCFDVSGVRLPQGYFFGASSVTGDLSGTIAYGAFHGYPSRCGFSAWI